LVSQQKPRSAQEQRTLHVSELGGAGGADHLHATLVHSVGVHPELNEALVIGRAAVRRPAEHKRKQVTVEAI
jgi:hypothetical protein